MGTSEAISTRGQAAHCGRLRRNGTESAL